MFQLEDGPHSEEYSDAEDSILLSCCCDTIYWSSHILHIPRRRRCFQNYTIIIYLGMRMRQSEQENLEVVMMTYGIPPDYALLHLSAFEPLSILTATDLQYRMLRTIRGLARPPHDL